MRSHTTTIFSLLLSSPSQTIFQPKYATANTFAAKTLTSGVRTKLSAITTVEATAGVLQPKGIPFSSMSIAIAELFTRCG